MKAILASLTLFLAMAGPARATADSADLPPTTVRFSAVCEEGWPESKAMVMKGRTVTETYTVLNDPIITEKDILKAKAVPDSGGFSLLITLKPSGQTKLNAGVVDMMDKQLAIVINDTLISAPVLKSVKFGPTVSISGNFTEAQATKIAEDLSH